MDPADGHVATAEPGNDPAPEVAGESESPTPSPEAAATETETPAAEETPSADNEDVFRLADVPEDVRPHAERLQKQMQAALSRARAEDAEKVQRAERALELVDALNDPDNARSTLQELASRLGMTVAEAEQAVAEATGEEGAEESDLEKQVRELREAEEQRQTQAEKEANARRAALAKEHVEDALDDLADARGVDELDPNEEELVTLASVARRGADGLPDAKRAVELVEAIRAAAVDEYLKAKRKDAGDPAPAVAGSTGTGQHDTSTERGRLDAANKIAARHGL